MKHLANVTVKAMEEQAERERRVQSIVETVAHLSHVIICVINYRSVGARPMPCTNRTMDAH